MPDTRSQTATRSNTREEESEEEHDTTIQGQTSSVESKLAEIMRQLNFLQAEVAKGNSRIGNSEVPNRSSANEGSVGHSNSGEERNEVLSGNGSDSGTLAAVLSDLSRTLSNPRYEQGRKLYDLPEFDGRPEDWPMFHESFENTTEEFNYTNQKNLMRLQKALKGKAKEEVECLLIHSSNVGQIMETLRTQFGRPEMLVKSQILKIRNIPPIPENCIVQILPFSTKVKNLASFLKAAKCEHHLSNPTLMDELLLKLPVERRLEWARYARDINVTLTVEHLSEWLQVLANEVRVACTDLSEPKARNAYKNDKPTRFFLANDMRDSFESAQCGVCSGKHDISKCKRFLGMSCAQRWRVARRSKMCFNCLERGHQTNSCTRDHDCSLENCTRKLHKLLHGEQNTGQDRQLSNEKRQSFTATATFHSKGSKLLFKIIPVKLYANGLTVRTFAFIDEGSSISLINKSLADRLQLKGPEESLTMQWFANNSITEKSRRVDMKISGVRPGAQIFEVNNVRTATDLRLPTQSLDIEELRMKCRLPKDLPIYEYKSATPEILIGLDNIHLGISRNIITDGKKGPAIVSTRLGWVVYGKGDTSSNFNRPVYFVQSGFQDELDDLVRNYIADENLGVRAIETIVESVDMIKARYTLEKTTKRIGTGFETGLLWRNGDVILPPSKEMAERRLVALEKKFQRNEEFHGEYSRLIEEYERKGYSRKLSPVETHQRGKRTWYLPHFGVVNPNKPGKLRLVFDAAAEVKGTSLNSMLLSGPDGCQPLAAVLMKFRQGEIGVCADIVEMFHQVKIRREDQDSQRFLWRACPNEPVQEYVMTSMTFGATCSPCSAQFVKNKNAEEFRNEYPAAVEAIINNHYVDDYVHCFSSEQEAIQVTKEIVWIQKQAGFQLRRFVSNSNFVKQELGEATGSTSLLSLNKGEAEHLGKVLGLHWDTSRDVLKFVMAFGRINSILLTGEKKPTKREMLAISMSVFDPFGLAAEYTLIAKLALQSVWRVKLEWDQEIHDEANVIWLDWIRRLKDVQKIEVPRCYSSKFRDKAVELHIFADASEQAYATVAYWRTVGEAGRAQLAFVAGKTKCAPLRATSIPRLELQSAVLATRLRQMILQCHDVTPVRVVMWSDASTVLAWIRSDHRRYKPYVAHRVSEILGSSKIEEWRWLPSAHNPADFGTRLRNEKRESLWLEGPEFLKNEESSWPQQNNFSNTQEELRTRAIFLFINNEDPFERFSCFQKMRRVFGWIKRFQANCQSGKDERKKGGLTPNELKNAELLICRRIQMIAYADEYEQLSTGNSVGSSSSLRKLNPIMDANGVIRINGRINSAFAVPIYVRNPIIMPRKNRVVDLIVKLYHEAWNHQNESTIINEIRRHFWIPHIRTVVRQVSKRCMKCQKERAQPKTPMMGQLPEDRLTPFVRPFSYVGLDYMGPFLITTGRRTEKRWIALFTCLTIRAIHLEIVRDLTADACLMSIRNFINRRGTPVRIRSDNGTSFVGADKELNRQLQQWNNGLIPDTLANSHIEWVFNCPLNPHAGGCWERLVRSVKRAMGRALYCDSLQEHTLYSLMCEAENMVNSRPLTHIPLDAPTDEPLTPNHFLLGVPNSEQTPHPCAEDTSVTRKQWRKVQQARHRFWNQWLAEYLPDLCRRTKWYQPVESLAVNDIVLICDKKIHRFKWPMGRIIRVFPGKDSQVRIVEVQTQLGVLKRPACMIAKLEVSEPR